KGLMKKNKIDIFKGHGRILGPSIFSPLPGTISIEHENDEENTMLVPKKIIIAIGSESKELKELPFDEELILSSTGALNLTELPKRVCIIGAGAIGIEWASMLVDLDVEVTVIEKDKNILPQVDFDVREKIKSILEARGVRSELKELPFDEELILSSTGALNLTELPKRVCIIGAGAIGIEWASMLVDLDVEVTVIEKDKNILPQVDFDVREKIKSILEARGVEFYLESQFTTNITNDSTIDFKINEKEEVTV